jgi:hypothetical protein
MLTLESNPASCTNSDKPLHASNRTAQARIHAAVEYEMTTTHFFFLRDRSRQLEEEVRMKGPIQVLASPLVELRLPSNLVSVNTNRLISEDALRWLSELAAITCEYDSAAPPCPVEEIDHHLEVVGVALQLVKPTTGFMDYRLHVDSEHGVRSVSIPAQHAHFAIVGPYLTYQQHHTVSPEDVKRAIGFLPVLSKAMELHHGSWVHPYGSIHRAIVLFCQGYTQLQDLSQLLWAAGLDCLFASKRDGSKRGARAIALRLQKLWGVDFRPYKTALVEVPMHQTRPDLCLGDVAEDIFRLRNAYIHGLSIPEAWLSRSRVELWSGYAYQLLECTEILLRLTLLRLLEDSRLLSTFLDANDLDRFFA